MQISFILGEYGGSECYIEPTDIGYTKANVC